MFSFLKPDPIKKLRKEYDAKLEQGMQAQRKGDIKSYAILTDELKTRGFNTYKHPFLNSLKPNQIILQLNLHRNQLLIEHSWLYS